MRWCHRIQNSSKPGFVSVNFNRAPLIYLRHYHGNDFKLWIFTAQVWIYIKRIEDCHDSIRVQLCAKLNEARGSIFSVMMERTFITAWKRRKKIRHGGSVSEREAWHTCKRRTNGRTATRWATKWEKLLRLKASCAFQYRWSQIFFFTLREQAAAGTDSLERCLK